jgi:hypothetical protein
MKKGSKRDGSWPPVEAKQETPHSLARMSLPTGDVRLRRNIADSNICSLRNVAEDSWRHSLLNCNMARSVWALFDEEEYLISNHSDGAKL